MALVYSCCFWFSLRLGGIIIGLFSIFQGTLILIASCIAHNNSEQDDAQLKEWYDSWNLVSSKEYMENIIEDHKSFTSIVIGMSSAYITACILYIYGAYICNNVMMFPYILFELLRLILVSVLVATGLLLLKENTMDIGSLIGASVVGGFFLCVWQLRVTNRAQLLQLLRNGTRNLPVFAVVGFEGASTNKMHYAMGMFYLWVCSATLPVLINEIERDEQAATIAKLQQLLTSQRSPQYRPSGDPLGEVFVVRKHGFDKAAVNSSRIPIAY